jgi:cell wall-associated NlpC family hydrolase
MHRFLVRTVVLTASLLLAGGALAEPATEYADLDGLLQERGLVERLADVRDAASHRASELILNALGFLGVPYRFGGTSIETGLDCSGFVRAVYQQALGKVLPRRSDEQAAATRAIDRSELQPGDLVFFNTMRRAFSHVGIYVGDGKFIHAPRAGAEVRLEDMRTAYWQKRFNGARRVIEAAD